MKVFTSVNNPEIVRILEAGGIGVIRTDTLYGLVGLASDEAAVERIFVLKGRDADKSPIVLISETRQLFDEPGLTVTHYLETVWPGPVSVILPSVKAPIWIRRSNGSVAYRLPDDDGLRLLLQQVGPLIAPSANPQGMPPATSIDEAIHYFSDKVDFYVDGGPVMNAEPSRLVRFDEHGKVTRLR